MKQSRKRGDPKAITRIDGCGSHIAFLNIVASFVCVMANEEPITMKVLTKFGLTKSGIDIIVIPSARFLLY